jgi:hypothetical protein
MSFKKQRYEAGSEALTPLEHLEKCFMSNVTHNDDTARYFMPQIVLHILSFLFFFEDYESEGHLVKSSISFEFDERILQVQPVPNSKQVVIVTTNGLYVYVCDGKRNKLIMRNETSLSKVCFTENYMGGCRERNQMDVWKVLPSHFAHFAHCDENANRKIEFVTSDCFLLQSGRWLTFNHLNQSGRMIASSDRYLCPSLFATMGDKVCVLGMDAGVLCIDILTHSFDQVLRIKLDFQDKPEEVDGAESPLPGLEEWSSWSLNERYLIMVSEQGRLYILQIVRDEKGDISEMPLVYQLKTHHVYYDVDLSSSDMALLCCDDSETGAGLLRLNVASCGKGKGDPVISEQSALHFTGGVPFGEERYMVQSYKNGLGQEPGNEIVCNKDGSINHEADQNTWGVSAYVQDHVNGSSTSASVSNGGLCAYANALGTVCVCVNASERLFLGNEKDLTDPTDDKFQTRTAVEVVVGSTRLNGWKYNTVLVHNGTKASIIHMRDVPEPDVRALENGIRMRM